MWARSSALGVVLSLAASCGGAEAPAATYAAVARVRDNVSGYGLEVEASSQRIPWLAWQPPPTDCAHVYRITASHTPTLMHESDSVSSLGLAHDAAVEARNRGAMPIPSEVEPLRMFYKGIRAEKTGVSREAFISPSQIGPASPAAACYPRTWDPMEDALALGWPHLPHRSVAVDETWKGQRVEGKCNISACIDPKTGGGGPDNHHRSCVTMDMAERLSGVVEVAGHPLAVIESWWSDGHGDDGIRSERMTLVSIEAGRPVWSRTKIHHPFPQMSADGSWSPIERVWTLESIDDCPGSLQSVGWVAGPQLEAEVEFIRAELEHSHEHRSRARERRKADGNAPDLGAGADSGK